MTESRMGVTTVGRNDDVKDSTHLVFHGVPQVAVQCQESLSFAKMLCPLRSRMKMVKVTGVGQQFSNSSKVPIYVGSFLDVLV